MLAAAPVKLVRSIASALTAKETRNIVLAHNRLFVNNSSALARWFFDSRRTQLSKYTDITMVRLPGSGTGKAVGGVLTV